jgi:hypothetical protein
MHQVGLDLAHLVQRRLEAAQCVVIREAGVRSVAIVRAGYHRFRCPAPTR